MSPDEAKLKVVVSEDLDATETPHSEEEPVTEPQEEEPKSEEEVGKQEEEVVVTIGEKEQPAKEDRTDSSLVRHLRKVIDSKEREALDLQRKLSELSGSAESVVPGKKPTLESCDYDAEEFEKQLSAWHEKKVKLSERDIQKKIEEQRVAEHMQMRYDAYRQEKTKLPVRNYDVAEQAVITSLNQWQQNVVLAYAKNPALVVYALGTDPDALEKLSKITDQHGFAVALGELQSQIKMTPRKPATTPEKIPRGNAPVTGSIDRNLERLREEAARTGDFTRLHEYKQKLRAQQRG